MRRELRLALELDRRVAIGGATEAFAIPEGCVIRNTQLPRMRHLNEVVLDAPLPAGLDAAGLSALAERHLRGATDWFARIDDAAGAERLEPELTAAGWSRGRTVLMVRGAKPPPVRDPRARRITRAQHEAVMLANFEAGDYGADASPELPELLREAQRAMLAGSRSQVFGAGDHETLASMCELFLDPDVDGVRMAMVEEVGTLPACRGRGLAKAVVSEAIAAAGEWGAELITVPADADDWPQMIYAGLGFEPVGTQVHFTLRGGRT